MELRTQTGTGLSSRQRVASGPMTVMIFMKMPEHWRAVRTGFNGSEKMSLHPSTFYVTFYVTTWHCVLLKKACVFAPCAQRGSSVLYSVSQMPLSLWRQAPTLCEHLCPSVHPWACWSENEEWSGALLRQEKAHAPKSMVQYFPAKPYMQSNAVVDGWYERLQK